MTDRLTDREAVRRALMFGAEWERSLIDAYRDQSGSLNHLDDENQRVVDDCRKNIQAFRRVLDRYFGGRPKPLPLKLVDIRDIPITPKES